MCHQQGDAYTFETKLPENGQVIEVQNPLGTWLEVLFSSNEMGEWSLVFDEEDIVLPEEALEFFPIWREEQLQVMVKKELVT